MRPGESLITGGRLVLTGYVMSDEVAGWAWEEEVYFCPRMVREALAALPEGEADVRLNSRGGDPVAGETIRAILADHPGGVKITVEGEASSAASLLLMGAARREMTGGSYVMIHDPSTYAYGTATVLRQNADRLDTLSAIYAGVYAEASGLPIEQVMAMMTAETFMGPQEAIRLGFVHAVAGTDAEIPLPPEAEMRAAMRVHMQSYAALMRDRAPEAPQAAAADPITAAPRGIQPAHQGLVMEASMPTPNPTPAPPQDAAAQTQAAVMAERERIAGIRSMAAPFMAAGRLNESDVQALVTDGTSTDAAGARLMATMAAREPLGQSGNPAASRILRDEVDTRRDGMEGALVAQMSGAANVDGPARDYMAHGLVEMAAASLGRAVPRNPADRLRTLEMALGPHTTGDLPSVLENALNRRLLAGYAAALPTYRQIAARMDFNDFRAHPVSGMGDFPTLLAVPEGGEIKRGSTSDKKESVTLGTFGRVFSLSRQMLVNDDLRGIDRMISRLALVISNFEEVTFYATAFGGSNSDGPTLTETSRQVYNTTDGTKAGTATAITNAALGLGRAAIRKQKGLGKDAADKISLNLSPTVLLVGPDKETEAETILTAVQANAASGVNIFSGRLQVVTTNQITGNAWHLFADPGMAPVYMWGHLNGAAGPQFRMDAPFGVDGLSYSTVLDFGCGAVDFRGTYKNAGA